MRTEKRRVRKISEVDKIIEKMFEKRKYKQERYNQFVKEAEENGYTVEHLNRSTYEGPCIKIKFSKEISKMLEKFTMPCEYTGCEIFPK